MLRLMFWYSSIVCLRYSSVVCLLARLLLFCIYLVPIWPLWRTHFTRIFLSRASKGVVHLIPVEERTSPLRTAHQKGRREEQPWCSAT
jgi:hypothetical protein